MNRIDPSNPYSPADPTPAGQGRYDKRLDYSSLPTNGSHPEFLEIDTGFKRRWFGLMAYLGFYLVVASALVLLFVQFTDSLPLAIGLVGFMVAYMALMGRWAGKNMEGKDQ